MKKITEEWLKSAQDDLDVIERIIADGHLSHMAAFHAQQCLEKVFKAVAEEHDIQVQKIHNLVTLYGRIESFLPEGVELKILKTLDSLYVGARYPGELGLLPDGRPTAEDARGFYAFAQEIFQNVGARLR